MRFRRRFSLRVTSAQKSVMNSRNPSIASVRIGDLAKLKTKLREIHFSKFRYLSAQDAVWIQRVDKALIVLILKSKNSKEVRHPINIRIQWIWVRKKMKIKASSTKYKSKVKTEMKVFGTLIFLFLRCLNWIILRRMNTKPRFRLIII